MRTNRFLWGIALTYSMGLVLLGLHFQHALNTDAVAYLRIASYYAAGKWDLAVSGYWGPLASWFMAVFLKLGVSPLAAGRGFMGVSAIVFLWGCVAVFRTSQLPEKWELTGAVLAALSGLYWSVQFITPDLFLGGLIGLAVSRQLAGPGLQTTSGAIRAGLWWGLACLTKAVAFPLAILATLAFGALALRNDPLNRRPLLRNLALIFLALGLVAGPWVLTLSLKYRTPTFSTTPRISHALTGPPDTDRYHPFARQLRPPAPGRITDWEEPSRMDYRYWSPFESPAYAWHQLKVIGRNIFICLALLTSLNVAWPALILSVASPRTRRRIDAAALRILENSLVVPFLLLILYLPCYVTWTEQRFFYAAFPFVFTALAQWAVHGRETSRRQASEATWWWWAVLGGIAPLAAAVLVAGDAPKMAGDYAADLARRVESANQAGPVAGSGALPGGRAGLYLAFLLNQPWYGDELHPSPASLSTCGARLVVVTRRSQLASALDQDPAFVNLDRQLFAGPTEAVRYPLIVYQINRPASVPDR